MLKTSLRIIVLIERAKGGMRDCIFILVAWLIMFDLDVLKLLARVAVVGVGVDQRDL